MFNLSDRWATFGTDGFRKVKSESMEHTDWWEFRHPQFLRDEPNLLSEIKRSVHFCKWGLWLNIG